MKLLIFLAATFCLAASIPIDSETSMIDPHHLDLEHGHKEHVVLIVGDESGQDSSSSEEDIHGHEHLVPISTKGTVYVITKAVLLKPIKEIMHEEHLEHHEHGLDHHGEEHHGEEHHEHHSRITRAALDSESSEED